MRCSEPGHRASLQSMRPLGWVSRIGGIEWLGSSMRMKQNTGRNPTAKELAEAKRIAAFPEDFQRRHPSALRADESKLDHINTYGSLPEYYIDRPFRCRDCGREEIWRAADQKWY